MDDSMRDLWVDYAKGIGIVLVVYGHVASGLFNAGIPVDEHAFRLADSVVYSFHMPLFFFLSGLFFYSSLEKRGAVRMVASKVDTILYPYVVWSLIQGCIEVLLSRWTNGHITLSEVLNLFWRPRAQFWFLYALFFISLICTAVFVRVPQRRAGWVTVLAALLFLVDIGVRDLPLYGYIRNFGVYFVAGIYFNSIKDWLLRNQGKLLLPALLLFLGGQYLFHRVWQLNWSMRGAEGLALAVVSIAFVCLLCMTLASRLPPVPWLRMLGTYSMVIFLMHTLAAAGCRIALKSILHVQNYELHLALGWTAGILLPMLAYRWLAGFGIQNLITAPPSLSVERWCASRRAAT
jgi:fucose 4-O-acetylase-like acetyltransferase